MLLQAVEISDVAVFQETSIILEAAVLDDTAVLQKHQI